MRSRICLAGGMAEVEAGRRAFFLERLAALQKVGGGPRKSPETGLLPMADAVIEAAARPALRQRDPFVAAHAVALADVVPAAVFGAEIVGEIGHIEQLVREFVRVVIGADDEIGPGADIGRDRRLWTDGLPALGVHPHRDPALLGEFLGRLGPVVDVALNELLPAQNADRRALLRLALPRRLRLCRAGRHEARSCRRGGDRHAGLPNFASAGIRHRYFFPRYGVRAAATRP